MALLGKNIPERTAEALRIAEDSKPEVADNLIDTAVTSQPQDNENTEPTKELGTIPNGEGEDGKQPLPMKLITHCRQIAKMRQ